MGNPKLSADISFCKRELHKSDPCLLPALCCAVLALGLSEQRLLCFLSFFWSTGALGLSGGISNHDQEGNTGTTIFMLWEDRAFLLSSVLLQTYGSMKTVVLGQIRVRHYARPCSVWALLPLSCVKQHGSCHTRQQGCFFLNWEVVLLFLIPEGWRKSGKM